MEKVSKKIGTGTNKRKAPVLVSSENILFHKETHKRRVKPAIRPKSQDEVFKGPAFKKAGAEAVGYAAAIVAGEGSQLLLPPLTIDPTLPPAIEHIVQEGDPGSRREGKGKEKTGGVPWKDLRVATQPENFEYVNSCLAGRRFTFDELGEPLAKDESDCDRMLKLSSYVSVTLSFPCFLLLIIIILVVMIVLSCRSWLSITTDYERLSGVRQN